ncbi:MAG: EF-P 5-aminopentanol modification-associated protein YfmF [Bacilli bacterium]
MNIETHNMGAYNLHFIKTDKFKTITIDVNFYRKIKEDEVTKRNLLKMILLDSNNDYKTERELIIESERLYDIKISSSISRIGEFSDLSFQTKFLNEKFTEEDMNKESIIFFLNLIFNPYIKDNKFINIDKQKNKLLQEIISIKDNKVKYSILKLMEKMKDKPYSYNPYGSTEELDQITGKDLYDYYKKVLNEDQIDIFVLGDFSSQKMKDIFKEYFKVTTFKKENKKLLVKELVPRKRIVKYHEYNKVSQSQLVLLCSLNNLTDFERKYTIKLYSEILGGSSNSILFSKVREEKSYCYYINSGVKAYDNILIINSGMENKNVEPAIKLIRKCLKDINNGKISDDILESSKNTIISSIKTSSDTPSGIINTALSRVLVSSDSTTDRINNFSKITKEDIIKVSKKVNLHTILTLENKEDDHEED